MVLREDRVSANFTDSVVAYALAFMINKNVDVVLEILLDNGRLFLLD